MPSGSEGDPIYVFIAAPKPVPVHDEAAAKGAAPSSGPSGVLGTIGALMSTLGAKIAAVSAPLAVLSATLGASSSGFSMLAKSVQILGSVLAPILLPLFITLGAAIISVSDVLAEKLVPGMVEAADLFTDELIPAIENVIRVMGEMVDFWKYVHSLIGDTGGGALVGAAAGAVVGGPAGAVVGGLGGAVVGSMVESGREDPAARAAKAGRGGDNGSGGGRNTIHDNQGMLLRDLMRSLGPQASRGSIEDARKNVEMAGLNAAETEQKILINSLKALTDALNRHGKKRVDSKPLYSGSGEWDGSGSLAGGRDF